MNGQIKISTEEKKIVINRLQIGHTGIVTHKFLIYIWSKWNHLSDGSAQPVASI